MRFYDKKTQKKLATHPVSNLYSVQMKMKNDLQCSYDFD